jgi:PAS domain S-box-containing protein
MAEDIRVLYVDDESGLLEIGKLFLEQEGELVVDTLTSAGLALEQLKTNHYDAIVSDYQMPEMDGIQLLAEVRMRFGNIPFILFTGRGREEVVIQAINNGVDFYLQKGGDPMAQFAELSNKIHYAVMRRRSEMALRSSLEGLQKAASRYEALIAASNTGAWEYHEDTGFLWCSPEYFSMLGRDIVDFDHSGKRNIEQAWIDLLHPDEREQVDRNFKEYLLNPDGMYEQYFRMGHRDGHYIWIWSRGRTLRNADGNLTSTTVGTHIDITERKRAEKLLAEREEKHSHLTKNLQEILDSISANICVLDRNGIITRVNSAWVRFAEENGNPGLDKIGVGVDHLAITMAAASGDEYARAAYDGIRNVLAGSVPEFSLTYPCASPDAARWFIMKASRLSGPDGGPC